MHDSVYRNFTEDTFFNGKRYVVGLPFKPDIQFVPDNYSICYKRLMSLFEKLNKDQKLKEEYMKVFETYEAEGIIEKVDNPGLPGQVHYMPHRPVIRSDRDTTKVRPVFDGSAKVKGGKSKTVYTQVHHFCAVCLILLFDLIRLI